MGHAGVGWGGLCRGGMGHYKGKHDYKMHIYHDHKKLQILHNVTTKQGSGNIKGADLCLAYDIGVWRQWGPLSVDMRPYGCFIYYVKTALPKRSVRIHVTYPIRYLILYHTKDMNLVHFSSMNFKFKKVVAIHYYTPIHYMGTYTGPCYTHR